MDSDKRFQTIVSNPASVLQHFSEETLEKDIVCLCGSLAEGFGNETSDIDVFVLLNVGEIQDVLDGDTDLILRTDQTTMRNIVENGIRLDIEYFRRLDIEDAIQFLNTFDFTAPSAGEVYYLSNDLIDTLHRLQFAHPLTNEESFFKMFQQFPKQAFGSYITLRLFWRYATQFEDLQGAFSSGDFGTTFVVGRMLTDLATNMFLALQGQTNPSAKWIRRKLEAYSKHHGRSLLEEYVRIQSIPMDERQVDQYVHEVVNYCERLNRRVQEHLKKLQN